jgi:hypothetical protein
MVMIQTALAIAVVKGKEGTVAVHLEAIIYIRLKMPNKYHDALRPVGGDPRSSKRHQSTRSGEKHAVGEGRSE